MRNVTIWCYRGVDNAFPLFVRVFEFKGRTQTLNQFLAPVYILRDGVLCGRDHNAVLPTTPWAPSAKGQTVVMGYKSSEDLWDGKGTPLVVTNTFDHAISWLNSNEFGFYGDESDRRVGVRKYINYHGRQAEYQKIAESYNSRQRAAAPVPQHAQEYKDRADEVLLPRAGQVVDNTDLNETLRKLSPKSIESPSFDMTEPVDRSGGFGYDSTIPVPPPKAPAEHKSFFRRVWDFLTK